MPDRAKHREGRPGKHESGAGNRITDGQGDGAASGAEWEEAEESEERSEEKADGLSRHWNGPDRPGDVKAGDRPDGLAQDKSAGRRSESAKSRPNKSS
jgi:hypothetical protein